MSGRVGSITTGIIADGLVLNMDAANRASYPVQRTLATSESGSCYNTLDLSQSGSFISDPQFVTQPVSASSWVFDGIDDYIQFALSYAGPIANIGTGPFTALSWASSTATTGYRWTFSNWATEGLQIGRKDNGKFATYIGNSWRNDSTYTIPSDNSWHNYVVSRDSSGNCNMYVDGVSVTTTFTRTLTLSAGNTSKIGRGYSEGQGWLGGIGNVQLYNRELSISEILHNYNALKGRFS